MLAWSEGTDNGTSENQKSWLWRHCRRRAIYRLPDHPRKLVTLNPKLKSTGAGRYQLLSCCGCSLQAAWPERLLSEKSDVLWHCSRLRSVALTLWLIVVDIRQAIDCCSNIWASLPGAGYALPEKQGWQPDCKIQRSGRNGQRDWCMSRVTAIISPLWLSASSSACHGLLIITVITPLPTKPSATKCSEQPKLANAANYWHADASAWCCCARCKIHEGS